MRTTALIVTTTALLASTLVSSQDAVPKLKGDIDRGLTPHFSHWLSANGYGSYGFERTDLVGGAFGGKSSDSDQIKRTPVIFFHGNSDIAVGVVDLFTGFSRSIEYFMEQGYSKSELYITTWGPGDKEKAKDQTHSKEYLTYLRAFMEAVLDYTGAEKVNVISHSMGVTLSRRLIKGGRVEAAETPFDLGPSLANRVETFIGIAGANYGLTNCYFVPQYPTCNQLNGFYPGYAIGPMGLSRYLSDLNSNSIKEANHVFAIFSTSDDLIGYGDIVYGQFTSIWPTVDASKTFTYEISCHMKLRDETANEQYNLITKHTF